MWVIGLYLLLDNTPSDPHSFSEGGGNAPGSCLPTVKEVEEEKEAEDKIE